ncbi:MAG: hypothetical protein MUE94_13115 [Verrucomicrobia bacterium]|nr:hypothetical protein [Verrucomicrobiota bacterium]
MFFKQIKQTLQLADFLGNSANAVQWQIWTALLTYVLLRFCAWLSQWAHSFTRLFALEVLHACARFPNWRRNATLPVGFQVLVIWRMASWTRPTTPSSSR